MDGNLIILILKNYNNKTKNIYILCVDILCSVHCTKYIILQVNFETNCYYKIKDIVKIMCF